MPSSTSNVHLGVCKITYNSVDLGYTKGGVEVEVSTDKHTVTVDQFGNTPISEYITGRSIVVRAPLAETTLENLAAIMPGTTVTGTTNKKASVNTGVGTNLLAIAEELRLHPIGLDEADQSQDVVIPLAASAGAARFAFKLDEERIFNAEFVGYPDETGKLFHVGYTTTT
jgi:hypothetical protein